MRLDPVLMCAVCRRPVDRWVALEEAGRMTRTFMAYCHGKTDACTLDMSGVKEVSDAIRRGRSVEVVAFAARHALSQAPSGEEGSRG